MKSCLTHKAPNRKKLSLQAAYSQMRRFIMCCMILIYTFCPLLFKFSVIQGVKKVRVHYTISYNFSSNVHSILKLRRFQELFNIKVSSMSQLLQLYFTMIKLEVYTQGVKRGLQLSFYILRRCIFNRSLFCSNSESSFQVK